MDSIPWRGNWNRPLRGEGLDSTALSMPKGAVAVFFLCDVLLAEHLREIDPTAPDADAGVVAEHVLQVARAVEPGLVGVAAVGAAQENVFARRGRAELRARIRGSALPVTGKSWAKNFNDSMSCTVAARRTQGCK